MSARLLLITLLLGLASTSALAKGALVFVSPAGNVATVAVGSASSSIVEDQGTQEPVWSPAGDRIAVGCHEPTKQASDICTMAADGSDFVRITDASSARYLSPTWSPDGQRIAFLSYPPLGSSSSESSLLAVSASGGEPQLIASTGAPLVSPAWSPDGRWIAAETNGIRLYSTDGFDPIQLTDGPGRDQDPSWSPDGRHIVFASNRLGGCSDLFIVNVDNGELDQLTPTESCGMQPAWSPDGAVIAFVAATQTQLEIRLIDRDGGNERLLTAGTHPDWGPMSNTTVMEWMSWGALKLMLPTDN